MPLSTRSFFVNVTLNTGGQYIGTIAQISYDHEIPFCGLDDAVFKIDRILDKSDCAQSPSELRSFCEEKNKVNKNIHTDYRDTDLLKNEDNQQFHCFMIDIKYRQNSSWQGCLTWRNHPEEPKKQNFRSVLELLKLIQSSFECDNSVQL